MSPYATKMVDYIAAEKSGAVEGECWKYYKDCPQSIFEFKERNKYSKEAQDNVAETDHESSLNTIEMLINEVMLWYLHYMRLMIKKSTVYYYYFN